MSALRQHSQQARAENAQLQLTLATHRNLVTGQQRCRPASFSSHVDIPGLASYEKHIQTLQRDKRCLQVELDAALGRVSELTETVDLLERQVDKIHREYRSKLVEFSHHSHLYTASPGDRIAREVRESYAQQLGDLRDRCRLYRSQTHKMRMTDKEIKLKQVLLEHSIHACPLDQTCLDSCLSVIRRISGIVEVEAYDPAVLTACGVIEQTVARLLPQLFDQARGCHSERERECPQSELIGQYDHLLKEIKSYKPS